MYLTNKTSVVSKLLIMLIFFSLFFAGTSKFLSYRGSWVEEKNRIALLEAGPQKGNWQTRDLSVAYEYRQEAKKLRIAGVVKLADYLTNGFSTLESLSLSIHFLDAAGVVLGTKGIKIFGHRQSIVYLGKMSFDRHLDLSADTVAVAFSYRGKVTQGSAGAGNAARGGGGDRIDWDFWKVPYSKPPQ